MAKITLNPNEKFEHIHTIESTTELISGNLIYHCNNQKIVMEKNKTIITPPNVPHTMENIGTTEAIFNCNHRV